MSGYMEGGYDQGQQGVNPYWSGQQGQQGQGGGYGGYDPNQQSGQPAYPQQGGQQGGPPNAWNRPLQHSQGPPGYARGLGYDYDPSQNSFFSGFEPQMGVGFQQPEPSYVRMRGLPYSATDQDVVNFFSGLQVLNVQLGVGNDNRPNGSAVVQFATGQDASLAMQRNRQLMGQRYIELFPSSGPDGQMGNGYNNNGQGMAMGWADPNAMQQHFNQQGYNQQGGYGPGPDQQGGQQGGGNGGRGGGQGGAYAGRGGYAAAAARQPSHNAGHQGGPRRGKGGNGGASGGSGAKQGGGSGQTSGGGGDSGAEETTVLRMRGLPYSAGEDEIRTFFASLNITTVSIVTGYDGRPSGEAYVEFASAQDASEGMAKNRESIGTRYIELFRSTHTDMQNRLKPRGGRGGGPSKQYDRAATLRLRGLPYRIQASDVIEFFDGYEVIAESVQFGTDYSGRSNGEAWVTFKSQEEALRAQKERDRAHMGSRYVELFTL